MKALKCDCCGRLYEHYDGRKAFPKSQSNTEPYPNVRGYKGEAVCVEMNGFCNYGERIKSNENHT